MIVTSDRSLTFWYVTAVPTQGLINNLETHRLAHSFYMPDNITEKISLNIERILSKRLPR